MQFILRRLLPLIIAVGLLYYAVKNVSLKDIVAQFYQLQWVELFTVFALLIISAFLRGKRWQLILIPLGYRPSVFSASVALQTANIGSMIFPGSGELTRCVTLERTDGVPIAKGLGLVFAERILDLFMMAGVLILAAILEFERLVALLKNITIKNPFNNIIIIICVVAVIVVGMLGVTWWVKTRTFHHPFRKKIAGLGQSIWEGFIAIRRLPKPGLFILLTILTQIAAYLMTYTLLLSLEITHGLPATVALTILAVNAIGGLAIPTQGGIGTFHFLVSRVLLLYGLNIHDGVIVATLLHAVQFGFSLAISSLSFLIIPILVQQRQERLKAESQTKA